MQWLSHLYRQQTIHSKLLVAFFSISVILIGTMPFFNGVLDRSQESAEQILLQKFEDMDRTEIIQRVMQNAEKWEGNVRSPIVIEEWIQEALSSASRLRQRQQIVNNKEGMFLTDDTIQNIKSFEAAFHATIDAWHIKGLTDDSGLRGVMHQAALTLEHVLNSVDQGNSVKTDGYKGTSHLSPSVDQRFDDPYVPRAMHHYMVIRYHEKSYFADQDNTSISRLEASLQTLQHDIKASGLLPNDKESILEKLNIYHTSFQNLVQQSLIIDKHTTEMQTKVWVIRELMGKATDQAKEELVDQFATIRANLREQIKAGLLFSVGVSLLGFMVIWMIASKHIVQPLARLKTAATGLCQGEWSMDVELSAQDEIGALAHALDGMVKDLQTQTRALTEAKVYADSIFYSMTDTLFVVTEEGVIQRVNRIDLLDYSEQELVGLNITRLLILSAEPEMSQPFCLLSLSNLMNKTGVEVYLKCKDGRKIPVLVSGSPMHGLSEEKKESIIAIKDITRIKEFQLALEIARDMAEETSHSKSLFVANMSHEIRTPMNAILGLTHLCLKTETTPRQRDYLNKVYNAANTLLRIINDILDFSKVEAGKVEVEVIPFHLDSVLSDLSTLVSIKNRERDLEIIFSTTRGVPRVLLGDPTRLGQVLTNLANNAVKFTQSGEVVISIERVGEEKDAVTLQFSVRDTGIGMTADQISRLFQPFSQADNSTTRKYGGTGLGLTICKHLVERMGGSLKVESVPNQGSSFSFAMPFALPENAKRRSLRLPGDLHGKRALIIDDNKTSRSVLRAALESFSLQVTDVSSGMEGLVLLEQKRQEQQPFELLLLDWRMPGLDGVQTFHCLTSLENPFDLPTLIMVPHTEQFHIKNYIGKSQPEGYLDKPVQLSALFEAIMDVFGKGGVKSAVDEGLATPSWHTGKAMEGAQILLVEDNEINQQVGKELLEMAGGVVEIAVNGQEAVQKITEKVFDLVLMDIQMPVMDGYQATRAIRQMTQGTKLPILAMTANVMVKDLAQCWEAGMDGHIAKPIDPDKLFSTLRRWLVLREQNTLSGGGSDTDSQTKHPFPPLAGIDTVLGLSRADGNTKLYRSLLGKFCQNYGGFIAEIEEAKGQGDQERAGRLLHTLRGVAGTIGAIRLQSLTEKWESSHEYFPDFATELSVVIDSIERLFATTPEEQKSGLSLTLVADTAAFLRTLALLEMPLKRRRPKECEPILQMLANMAIPTGVARDMDHLVGLIKTYRLKEAASVLNVLMVKLEKWG